MPKLNELTAELVSAYVANNALDASDLPGLIQAVAAALADPGGSATPRETGPAKPTPAQIRKSITPEGLTCAEDGKVYKSMKRALAVRGLTPEAYRIKWGLPADYPMNSPDYTAKRSALAKASGLGARGRVAKR